MIYGVLPLAVWDGSDPSGGETETPLCQNERYSFPSSRTWRRQRCKGPKDTKDAMNDIHHARLSIEPDLT